MGFLKRRADLEGSLHRIEESFEAEDIEEAKKELRRAVRQFPENIDLKEWEAALSISEERFEEALRILDSILEKDPWRPYAIRERASVLIDLGRFPEALESLRSLLEVEVGRAHYEIGLCLDREGKTREADAEFREAARLAPDEHSIPPRLHLERFEALVAEAMDSIPDRFVPYLEQVTVAVQDYPSASEVEAGGLDPFVLGLYVGVPRTDRTWESADNLDRIIVFKRNHELLDLPLEDLREEVRKTVVHEIAHHFGLDEEEMGEYA